MITFIHDLIAKLNLENKQNKRILLNIFLSFLIKGGSLVVSLLTLPAYIRFFDNQVVLGLWFTAISFLSWILSFDLGIGNGLRNRLVAPFIKKDFLIAKGYISSAYIILGIFVLLVSITGYFVSSFINWNILFNVSTQLVSATALLDIVRIIFFGIMLQFLLRIISSILYALQNSAIPALLLLISNSLLLIFVLIAGSGDLENNLKHLALANIITTNLPLIVVTIYLFSTKLKKTIPNIKYYKKSFAIDIFMLGGIFFWLQVMFMLISSTNEFLITWFIGPGKVVEYKIYNSLFAMIGTLFTLLLTPMWSEVTEAFAKREFLWIKKIYQRLNYFAMFAIVSEFLLIIVLQFIINLWLGSNAISVDYNYAILFAVSGSLFIWNAVLSSIVNGLGKLKIPFIFNTIGAVINIPLAYVFVEITGSWISIILANIISMLPSCIMQAIWLNKYFKEIITTDQLKALNQ